jgi:hypothetical protein
MKENSDITDEQVYVYLLERYGSIGGRSFSSLPDSKRLKILRAAKRGKNGYAEMLNLYVTVDRIPYLRLSIGNQQKMLRKGRKELARALEGGK